MRWLTILLTVSITVSAAEPADPGKEAPSVAVQEAKSIRWKANLFAGAALLAVVAGIAVICIDGGTSTKGQKEPCHDHHHHHHDHNQLDDNMENIE